MDTTTAPLLTPPQILALYHSTSPVDLDDSSRSSSSPQHPSSAFPFTPGRPTPRDEPPAAVLQQCVSPQEIFGFYYSTPSPSNSWPSASRTLESASRAEVQRDRHATAEVAKAAKLCTVDSDFWDIGSFSQGSDAASSGSSSSSKWDSAFSTFSSPGSPHSSTSPSPLSFSKKADSAVKEWDFLTKRLLREQSTSPSLSKSSQRIDHWGFGEVDAEGAGEGWNAGANASDHNTSISQPMKSAAYPLSPLQLPSWSGNRMGQMGFGLGRNAVAAMHPRGTKRPREESTEYTPSSAGPSLPQVASRSKRPKIDFICRVNGCRHVAQNKAECGRHRDTHFERRFQCPNTACAVKYGRCSSLVRHLGMRNGIVQNPECVAAAGDRKGWGAGMKKFEIKAPEWAKDDFKLDKVEDWEFDI